MESHGAGHGVQAQHSPDALGARMCVPNHAIGDVIAGIGAQIAPEDCESEGQTGSLRRAILLSTKNVGWAVIDKY